MNQKLLVGATGMLGRHIYSRLESVEPIKVLSRQATSTTAGTITGDLLKPRTLSGCCDGIQTVISCAGASMSLGWRGGEASFHDVDWQGNRNLLAEAKRAGVQKFVYVAVNPAGAADDTIYVQAHENFVTDLRISGLDYTVVRPTGFFGFYVQALAQARQGWALVIGPGAARTNPIHEADVARACLDAIESGQDDMPVGGPEIFTRRQIAELALRIAGRSSSPRHVPAWAFRGMLPALRIANPRVHALFQFGIEVSLNDCIAPAYGVERLGDYLRTAFAT